MKKPAFFYFIQRLCWLFQSGFIHLLCAGTAHVLKGESIDFVIKSQGKSRPGQIEVRRSKAQARSNVRGNNVTSNKHAVVCGNARNLICEILCEIWKFGTFEIWPLTRISAHHIFGEFANAVFFIGWYIRKNFGSY